ADERAARLLTDPDLLARLKKLQADYFARLLDGVFDAAYYEARLRVGEAHQRVGLSPVLYLGAYNQYIQITFPLFLEAFGGDGAAVRAAGGAVRPVRGGAVGVPEPAARPAARVGRPDPAARGVRQPRRQRGPLPGQGAGPRRSPLAAGGRVRAVRRRRQRP